MAYTLKHSWPPGTPSALQSLGRPVVSGLRGAERALRCEGCGRLAPYRFALARLRLCNDCFDLQYIEFGVGA
jgi:hypothetical protein